MPGAMPIIGGLMSTVVGSLLAPKPPKAPSPAKVPPAPQAAPLPTPPSASAIGKEPSIKPEDAQYAADQRARDLKRRKASVLGLLVDDPNSSGTVSNKKLLGQ